MQKSLVSITITSESTFQRRSAEQMVEAATSAIADVHKSRHQKNDIEIVITNITPPHNEDSEAKLHTPKV